MPHVKTRGELADAAKALAEGYELVYHNSTLYLPFNVCDGSYEPVPDPHERAWKPLSRADMAHLALTRAEVLFASDAEMNNFQLMLAQLAIRDDRTARGVLLNTDDGLRALLDDGKLYEPDGSFYPNYISTPLNTSPEDCARVRSVIDEWVGSSVEATSLLHHLATALAPSWSAVKYILLLGEGRNGKSVMLQMVVDLFGRENTSNVTRQQMAEFSPVVIDLNGKLLNVVFDGAMNYVSDSGLEKTLIAGETGYVRKLYQSSQTAVQTNGLFLEALNAEPKSRDKSTALQKRIVRYYFPNVYELDPVFAEQMRSEASLGALLKLLLDHYVTRDRAHELLSPTTSAQERQLDHMLTNSLPLQWFEEYVNNYPAASFVGGDVEPFVTAFVPWALSQENITFSTTEARSQLSQVFRLKRSTRRAQTPRNYWKIVSLTPSATHIVNLLGVNHESTTVVVEE